MTRSKWRTRIIKATEEAGTYKPCFDDVIETLADILSRRDAAQAMFKKSGGNVLILRINNANQQNWEQNPALTMVNALNRDALAYWRDLGLTPAGLKRIDENAMKPAEKVSAFASALKKLTVV